LTIEGTDICLIEKLLDWILDASCFQL
jgi:hypothetical protein